VDPAKALRIAAGAGGTWSSYCSGSFCRERSAVVRALGVRRREWGASCSRRRDAESRGSGALRIAAGARQVPCVCVGVVVVVPAFMTSSYCTPLRPWSGAQRREARARVSRGCGGMAVRVGAALRRARRGWNSCVSPLCGAPHRCGRPCCRRPCSRVRACAVGGVFLLSWGAPHHCGRPSQAEVMGNGGEKADADDGR